MEKHDSRKKHDTNLVPNVGAQKGISETTPEVEVDVNSQGKTEMKDR